MQVRGWHRGPTRYGRTSIAESFAESFALFHVDPMALKRIWPAVYAWFASDGHISAVGEALARCRE